MYLAQHRLPHASFVFGERVDPVNVFCLLLSSSYVVFLSVAVCVYRGRRLHAQKLGKPLVCNVVFEVVHGLNASTLR